VGIGERGKDRVLSPIWRSGIISAGLRPNAVLSSTDNGIEIGVRASIIQTGKKRNLRREEKPEYLYLSRGCVV